MGQFQYFSIPSNGYFPIEGFDAIGNLTLSLPISGKVVLQIQAGYFLKQDEGPIAPFPSSFTYNIPIN